MKRLFFLFLCVPLVHLSVLFADDYAPAPSRQVSSEPPKTADEIIVKGALMEDFGIYEISEGDTIDAPNVTTGKNTVIYGKELLQQTDVIPAVRGLSFGFRYFLSGSPASKTVQVTIKVDHPPITNPQSQKTTETSFWNDGAWIGKTNWHTGWKFDASWEMVPGTWTISLIHKDKVLLKKSFTVKRV